MRPTFVLSLDEELAWGSFDVMSPAQWERLYPDPRGVVDELLRLFERYEVSATWAVVGHLMLSRCSRDAHGCPHGDLVRPSHAWYPHDWLGIDPCTDRARDPLFYGDDIIDAIRSARVAQELGCHSFSHIVYGDPGCSVQAARSDLTACVAAARDIDLELRSFVFPRNVEGHHALLREFGFTAFRGEDPCWYQRLPARARRAAHLLDQAGGFVPPVCVPRETLPGLWNIPGSMLLMSRVGVRRLISVETRVAKAKAGLRRAVRERAVFHLWLHPFNMARDRPAMFAALAGILDEAVRMRDAGHIEIATMGEIACAASNLGQRARATDADSTRACP